METALCISINFMITNTAECHEKCLGSLLSSLEESLEETEGLTFGCLREITKASDKVTQIHSNTQYQRSQRTLAGPLLIRRVQPIPRSNEFSPFVVDQTECDRMTQPWRMSSRCKKHHGKNKGCTMTSLQKAKSSNPYPGE
jgi:hypothetical protein